MSDMLMNEELHEQCIAIAEYRRVPYTVWKDRYFYNPRVQPIRRFWQRATKYTFVIA